MPPRTRQIALAFAVGTPYLESVMRGIMDHAREKGSWHFAFSPDAAGVSMRSLKSWRGDGVLAWIQHTGEARLARQLKVPVVNLSAQLRPEVFGLPTVTADHEAAGRLAAEHLLGRRHRNFGFYGLEQTDYSRMRLAGFQKAIEAAGASLSVCLTRNTLHSKEPWHWDGKQVDRWLTSLKKPAAVLAAHDYRARVILASCQRLNLRVPQDIAVAGVNNDVVTCEFCEPALTSVSLDGVAVGRQAAGLLESLMNGSSPPAEPLCIAPAGLVARASTQSIGLEDARISAAADFIETRCAHAISIEQAASCAGISRRLLEMRFREQMGCSPHAYLTRCRIERAKKALENPARTTLFNVARLSGFADTRRLKSVFMRQTGLSPKAWRSAALNRSRTPDSPRP